MDEQKTEARSVFTASIKGLAFVGGAIGAYLITPGLHAWSLPMILDFTATHYGEGWGDVVAVIWFIALGAAVFFGGAALLSMALLGLVFAAASWLR